MQTAKADAVPKKKLRSLQTVRTLAFISIFTSHVGITMLGPFGVSVFFVLSGFLMYYNYCDRELECSPKKNLVFAFNRIKRLYPLHIITMLAALPSVIEFLSNHTQLGDYIGQGMRLVSCTFLVQTWVPILNYNFAFNSVSWFLATCAFMYLIFPWYMNKVREKNSLKSAVIRLCAAAMIQFLIAYATRFLNWKEPYYSQFVEWVTYTCPLFRLGDFIIGCELACIFKRDKLRINKWLMTAAEALVFVALWFARKIFIGQVGFWGSVFFKYSILYLPVSCALVYLFARNTGYISKLLTNRVTVWIGDISGYAFLIHQLVVIYIKKLFPLKQGMSYEAYCCNIFAVSFVITLGLTLAYKYAYTKISQRRKQKQLAGQS